jgi:hypothetical protein
MFQQLDELQTGSLYILTGPAGAGKSHLAASARKGGTIWVLDTEGAAQTLRGKRGIHRRIQVLQTLSLRELTAAMENIRTQGKPGDTIILDSISKVFQAMRSYAQQRAGAETNRKATIHYDEHASVNRNMQTLYTELTTLKQAGFHVILIGHLTVQYRADSAGSLRDDGLRVLADQQIAYEADAILLVEREGEERSLTPIIKPPRPAHLSLTNKYPATLASLYPDLAVKEAKEPARRERRTDEAQAAPDEATAEPVAGQGQSDETTTPPHLRPVGPPQTIAEAEQRFYARYSAVVGGTSWSDVQRYLGQQLAPPRTTNDWIAAAEQVRDRNQQRNRVA